MRGRMSTWWFGASVAGLALVNGCGSDSEAGAGPGSNAGAGGAGAGGAGPGGAAGASGAGTSGAAGSAGSGGSGTGGAAGTSGGAAGVGGAPPDPTAACAITPERIRITEVNLGTTIVNDENEAALRPLVISAVPRGGSRLAFMGSDRQVRIAALDASDQLVGTPVALPANDFGDLYADDNGGVLCWSPATLRAAAIVTAARSPISAATPVATPLRRSAGTCTWCASTAAARPGPPS